MKGRNGNIDDNRRDVRRKLRDVAKTYNMLRRAPTRYDCFYDTIEEFESGYYNGGRCYGMIDGIQRYNGGCWAAGEGRLQVDGVSL